MPNPLQPLSDECVQLLVDQECSCIQSGNVWTIRDDTGRWLFNVEPTISAYALDQTLEYGRRCRSLGIEVGRYRKAVEIREVIGAARDPNVEAPE